LSSSKRWRRPLGSLVKANRCTARMKIVEKRVEIRDVVQVHGRLIVESLHVPLLVTEEPRLDDIVQKLMRTNRAVSHAMTVAVIRVVRAVMIVEATPEVPVETTEVAIHEARDVTIAVATPEARGEMTTVADIPEAQDVMIAVATPEVQDEMAIVEATREAHGVMMTAVVIHAGQGETIAVATEVATPAVVVETTVVVPLSAAGSTLMVRSSTAMSQWNTA